MSRTIFVIIVLAAALPFFSCTRHTLRYFFDGVDEPQKKEILKSGSQVKKTKDSTITGNFRQSDASNQGKYTHPDYKKSGCSKCHQIEHAYRLTTRQPDLCYQCHKPYRDKYKVLHGPVAAGFCTACHLPHQSQYNHLLKMPIREACTYCHDPGDVKKNQAHGQINTTACIQCHNSHGGRTIQMIKGEAN